mmetsp:Transcript_43781/g.39001  ORF Transcript_43781/g.39001 Transcript_43781/m.39001 type:complete len:148 (-) Transcript_43781:209-652(-)
MAARIHSTSSITNNSNPTKIHLFTSKISPLIFCKSPTISRDSFRSQWIEISDKNEQKQMFKTPQGKTNENMKEIFEQNSFVFVANRIIPNKGVSMYFVTELNSTTILLELSIANLGKCRIIVRSKHNWLSDIVCHAGKSLILDEVNK